MTTKASFNIGFKFSLKFNFNSYAILNEPMGASSVLSYICIGIEYAALIL